MVDSSQTEIVPTRRKVAESILSVGIIRIINYAIIFIGTVVLARIFDPIIFGIFGIVVFVLAFFRFFRDVGLGAALIQKKIVTQNDLRTAFTIQEILILCITVAIFFSAPFITQLYNLNESITWLIRALSITFFISSLGVIPSILLERKLEYKRLVIPDILGVITNYSIVVYLAYQGYGIWSFVPGMIISSVVSVTALFILSPWRVSFGIDRKSSKDLLKFGITFQLAKVFPLINNAGIPIVVGLLVGVAAIGYLNLAYSFGGLALHLLFLIDRIMFPTYSRLLDYKVKLKKAVENTIRYGALVQYPLALILIALAPYFVHFIYTDKWLPILPAVYIFLVLSFFSPLTLPVVNLLYAAGKPRTVLFLNIIWTSVRFSVGAVFVWLFGFAGWPLAGLINLLTLKYQISEMNKVVKVEIIRYVYGPALSAILTLIVLLVLAPSFVTGLLTMVLMGFIGLGFYFMFLRLIEGKKIIAEMRDLWKVFKSVFSRR